MNRLESMALGLAAGALAVSWVGAFKVIAGAVIVAGLSFAWRKWLKGWLEGL